MSTTGTEVDKLKILMDLSVGEIWVIGVSLTLLQQQFQNVSYAVN